MKIDGLTHPKTKDLAIRLGVPLPHAVGLLEYLWYFVGKQTPRGDIGKWSNGVIAAESQWDGDADEFVQALVKCRFLDECDDHRLVVHDWSDHAPRWVFAKLKKENKEILSPNLSDDLRGRYKGSEVKGSEVKGSGNGAHAPPPTRKSKNTVEKPDDIDEQVWSDFLAHRRQKKAKLTPTAFNTIRKQLDLGKDKGHDPNEMLSVAMAAGWQGFQFEWYENRVGGSSNPSERNGPLGRILE